MLKTVIRNVSKAPIYPTITSAAKPKGIDQISNPLLGNEPKFQAIKKGNGSLLLARLDQNDTIHTRVGSLISTFGPVETQLKLVQSLRQSIIHKLTGGSFFMEKVL